ncbi:MAG TPA: hypothetical protein VH327_05785 [Gammaproteobacteria bacterium]|jgi:hypothetical protein|nr:hypothetical protein [Gammaproteobacteria bacterium]
MTTPPSSVQHRLQRLRWHAVLGGGLAIFAAFVGSMELRLAARGFQASVIDSPRLWAHERERVDALGDRALIVVGGSRALLDLDLPALRRLTGLEPVQLAVDGSSFVPVLKGLAADPQVKGTVLVDLAENILTVPAKWDSAYEFEAAYDRGRAAEGLPDFSRSEAYLTDWLHGWLRSYADGTRPLTALRLRILDKAPTPQYLHMLPDRGILADYSRVSQPDFYYQRVIRNLGEAVPLAGRSSLDIERDFASRIASLPPFDDGLFLRSLPAMADMTRTLQSQGARVIYVVFPTSGYVRLIDDKRFPRPLFWDRFTAAVRAPALNFEDVPALRGFYCPDGSHLDVRMRVRFTTALVQALRLDSSAH